MMTLKTKSVFGLVAGLAIALSLVIGAGTASALTAADIDTLVALGIISADKAATAKAALTTTSYSSLKIGSTGADVVALQEMLVKDGYLVMPAGVKYGYYGSLTAAAYAKYQAAQVTTPVTGGSTSATGGDGDFNEYDVLGNPDSTDIGEGETEEVFAFEFEAEDSDLLVKRVEFLFEETGSNTDKPWKVLEEVSLSADGKEVASIDASDSDSWSEESTNDTYTIRFNDLKVLVEDGEQAEMVLSITAQDSLDTADLGTWDVSITDDGIRAENGEGIQVYEGADTAGDTRDFTLEAAEAGDMDVSVDDDDNEDITVEVDEDNDTNDVVIYTATAESQTGDNKIEEVMVSIATTTGTTNGLSDFVKVLTLYIDGKEVGSETVGDDDGAEDITFEDINVDVDEDDEVTIVVKADFDNQDGNYATTTTGVYVTGMDVDYVDEQDDDQTVQDTTDGGAVSLQVSAVSVELVSVTTTEQVGGNEASARFYVTFKVTAPSDEDVYIGKGATSSSAFVAAKGVYYQVITSDDATTTATTTSAVVTRVSGGSESGSYWKVAEDNSATLRLEVILSNEGGAAEILRGVQLYGVNYKLGSAAIADVQLTNGIDEDFRTSKALLGTENL